MAGEEEEVKEESDIEEDPNPMYVYPLSLSLSRRKSFVCVLIQPIII